MVPGSSAYKGIHALKPGHMLVVSRRGQGFDIRDQKYWDMDFPEDEARNNDLSAEYHIERTRETLTDAEQQRLEADVMDGCYLSGGIESYAMLGMAAAMHQPPGNAFKISIANNDNEER